MTGRIARVMIRFTDLAPQDLQSDEFRSRLHDAAELDDLSLDRIIADELPHLRNVGVYLGGHFVGFASYATAETGSELEYIAIDPAMRGRKLGQKLIASIPKPIHAITDDDAIGFYRALGFDTEPIAPTRAGPIASATRARSPRTAPRECSCRGFCSADTPTTALSTRESPRRTRVDRAVDRAVRFRKRSARTAAALR